MIHFTHPSYLFLLLLTPVMIVINFLSLKVERKNALKFANFEEIANIKNADISSNHVLLLLLSIVLYCLFILALSGISIDREVTASDRAYVLAIDSSGSMEANDILPNRIDAAKEISKSFVDYAGTGVKIGTVSFAGNALIVSELTTDSATLKEKIDTIEINSLGGTDVAEAITTATNMLQTNREKSRTIIVLSDGQINVEGIDKAIKYAQDNAMHIYTLAMGTTTGGNTTLGISKIDEESLKALAYETQGAFFRATNKEELQQAFKEIADRKTQNITMDISQQTLLVGALLFIFYYFLVSTRDSTF